MKRRGPGGLASLLGVGLVSAGLFFGSGCGRESGVRPDFIGIDEREDGVVSVLGSEYGVDVDVSPSPGYVGASPHIVFSSSSKGDIEKFKRSDSVIYLVLNVPIEGLRNERGPLERWDFDVDDAKKKEVLSIARNTTILKGAFDAKDASVHAIRGSDERFVASYYQMSRGNTTYFEGMGKKLTFVPLRQNEGVRAFVWAEVSFKDEAGNQATLNITGEGMAAPPWTKEIDGYWDCSGRGRFFFFDREQILSSDSFYSRGAKAIRYGNIYRKKDTIYLDAGNLNGERIVISSEKNKTTLTYFPPGVDIKDDGERMERMSVDAARKKY